MSSGKPGRGQFTREERERRGGKGRDEASQEFPPQETRVRGGKERRPEDPSFSGAGKEYPRLQAAGRGRAKQVRDLEENGDSGELGPWKDQR